MKEKYSCLLLIFLSSLVLPAQNFSSIHYSEKDGLPSNTVYDITQDKDGFIWFGTENGLSRFDGRRFRNFTTKEGLPDNAILRIMADNTGRVFFSPFTHTPFYYFNDSIYPLKIPDSFKTEIASLTIYYKWEDKIILKGVTTNLVVEKEGASVKFLSDFFSGFPQGAVVSHVTDSVIVINKEDSIFSIIDKKIKYIGPLNTAQFKASYTKKGTPIQIENVPIASGSPTNNLANRIFFASKASNVFLFDAVTGKLLYQLKAEKISTAFIDTENNLWITTLGNGVYRFPSFEFKHTDFDKANEIFTVNSFNGNIIAGGDFSKSYILNRDGDYSYTDYSSFLRQSNNPVARSTKRNRILKFLPLQGTLFIATDAFLLKITKNQDSRFSPVFPVKDIDTAAGQLLVCTGRSILLLNKETMAVNDTLLNQRSTCGVFYQGNYYIGTYGGLIKIEPKNKITTSLGIQYPSLRNRIIAIKKGADNDLWIASSGSGLIHFKNGKVIHILNTETGITGDICTSLFIDSNEIWLGTSKGLNRIIPRGENWDITSITTANGLAANFINSVYVHNNVVYAGTSAGLTYFNKNSLSEKSICRLHITGISAGNNTLKKDSILSFPHNTLNIKIEFTAISFKSAGDIRYYHRLKGLEDDWNVTTDNFVNYSTLPPGDYTLLIKAINKFGVESETKTISIRIQPAWWQTWPFWLAVIALLLLLTALLYRRSIHSIRKKEKLKRETEARFAALEQQALQAQMNPHFIFNSLNSIQSFILDLDVEGANKYLATFASLIRQTLDNSSSPFISLSSELKYLDTYLQLEKLRFKDKFNYRIQTGDNINQQATLIPGMLLQPYVENSLRHGIQHRKDNQGIISIEVTGTTGGITYTIKDNGVGRKKSEELKSRKHIEYQSKGTAISLKRIKAINNQFGTDIRVNIEDITGTDGTVEGTIVTLFIPHLNTPVL
ncbi:MAG: histidine kinase [Chitinophagales bacterium]|nr:histidine kinase [Chitinophagales bacterium]